MGRIENVQTRHEKRKASIRKSAKQTLPKDRALHVSGEKEAVAETRDGLKIYYRRGTSDIKAIREACANLLDEQKRSSSYERVRRNPIFTISAGDVWLDCGAHIGSFTLRALKNGAKKVISVEPERNNIDLFKKNIAANGMSDRNILENCALVADSAMSQVNLNRTKSTYRHTLIPTAKVVDSVAVPAKTLVQLLQDHPTVTAVKLDIEGNEKSVLESVNWKSTAVERLVFEFSFDHHPNMNEFHDLIDYMAGHYETVFHHASIPPRGETWNTKVTRGANGRLIWCCGKIDNHKSKN